MTNGGPRFVDLRSRSQLFYNNNTDKGNIAWRA